MKLNINNILEISFANRMFFKMAHIPQSLDLEILSKGYGIITDL